MRRSVADAKDVGTITCQYWTRGYLRMRWRAIAHTWHREATMRATAVNDGRKSGSHHALSKTNILK